MNKRILLAEPQLDGNESKYLQECIESNFISSVGPFVSKFETLFSEFCETKYGVATANGTVALHLALEAVGIKPEDEVILPTFTMIASANAISYTGAKIRLIDSDPVTWNIDPNLIEKKITKQTRAILVVDIYGHPVDMDPIIEIADKHNLFIIEDAAESHGAEYKGRKVGGLGHVGCFSFYANKIITTGEGGMIVTNDKEIADKAASLRNLAFDKERRFKHSRIAYNYRMTNLQAAVGVAQLERINNFINRRRRNAQIYNEVFSRVEEIQTPAEQSWAKNVYWMYSILANGNKMNRDRLMAELDKENIETRVMFNPMHFQDPYRTLGIGEKFPVAEGLSKMGLNLPSGNNLTDDVVAHVATTVRSIMSR
jgi:perosamine synthetase